MEQRYTYKDYKDWPEVTLDFRAQERGGKPPGDLLYSVYCGTFAAGSDYAVDSPGR